MGYNLSCGKMGVDKMKNKIFFVITNLCNGLKTTVNLR